MTNLFLSITTIILLNFVISSRGKVFTRCGLVDALRDKSFPENLLPDWVCLVENESARNTKAIGGPNKDGSSDYGLFQINSVYWCKVDGMGHDCNINCNSLLEDDISIASICAKKIFKRHGFKAWHGWTKRCENKTLPDISNCTQINVILVK